MPTFFFTYASIHGLVFACMQAVLQLVMGCVFVSVCVSENIYGLIGRRHSGRFGITPVSGVTLVRSDAFLSSRMQSVSESLPLFILKTKKNAATTKKSKQLKQ